MSRYKVRNFKSSQGWVIQQEIERWIEIQEQIHLMGMNVWCDNEYHYAIITYQELNQDE